MDDKSIIEKLIQKSIEAFTVGIELYNKPTIKYRVEGFSFFACNAWELLSYSQAAIDFILEQIKKAPERIVQELKDKIKS